jgi:aminoglycoside phosphotransferase (APT) family kinase protein
MDSSHKGTSIRKGERLDPRKILSFLMENVPGLRGEIEIKQFANGFSGLTYLIKSGDKEMVLRKSLGYDMGRKYRILKALKPFFPYCPAPLAYSEDQSIIGCPFYVMEKIPGLILRKNLPPGLNFLPSDARTLCEQLVDVHVKLHSIDHKTIGLASVGDSGDYVARQVRRWTDRYHRAHTPGAPDYAGIISWLKQRIPSESVRPAIIHNDFKLDNVVLDLENPLRIVGVLDWEMVTIGDPLMDLGNSLAYWVERGDPWYVQLVRQTPSNMRGALTRKELVELYAARTGTSVSNFDFYYCFGLFRLAVIAQQFFYRFYTCQARDMRYMKMIFAVRFFKSMIERVISGRNNE